MEASADWFDWLVVAILGGLVGTGELVSRYRDAPARALRSWPAGLYVTLNAVAAVVALILIHAFHWTFSVGTVSQGSLATHVLQILVAGFGAMALLRSSLFIIRSGDQDIAVGLASFIQIGLDAADRSVDRTRGGVRSTTVAKLMQGVVFTKAQYSLPTYCLALMQNLSQDDQQKFARQIAALGTAQMDENAKVLALGLAIMNVMGEDVLQSAIIALGPTIKS